MMHGEPAYKSTGEFRLNIWNCGFISHYYTATLFLCIGSKIYPIIENMQLENLVVMRE